MTKLVTGLSLALGLLALAANHQYASAQSFDFASIMQMIEQANSGCDPSDCTQSNSYSQGATVVQN